MYLQANGIRNGDFVGDDKEIDLIVDMFCLEVLVYEDADELSNLTEEDDLRCWVYESDHLPISANPSGPKLERHKIALLRESKKTFSLLRAKSQCNSRSVPQYDDHGANATDRHSAQFATSGTVSNPAYSSTNSPTPEIDSIDTLSSSSMTISTTDVVPIAKSDVVLIARPSKKKDKKSVAKVAVLGAAGVPISTTTAVSVAKPMDMMDTKMDSYQKCLASFATIRWNVHVRRGFSSGAGKGIFAMIPIAKHVCVALYFGHLVDSNGVVVVSCPFTSSLFQRLPDVQRPYSRAHCVKVNSVACPHALIVDGEFAYFYCTEFIHDTSHTGSHHACSKFDTVQDRSGVPWGSCLNSSVTKGVANCKIQWYVSVYVLVYYFKHFLHAPESSI
jgi:hypothetical protein